MGSSQSFEVNLANETAKILEPNFKGPTTVTLDRQGHYVEVEAGTMAFERMEDGYVPYDTTPIRSESPHPDEAILSLPWEIKVVEGAERSIEEAEEKEKPKVVEGSLKYTTAEAFSLLLADRFDALEEGAERSIKEGAEQTIEGPDPNLLHLLGASFELEDRIRYRAFVATGIERQLWNFETETFNLEATQGLLLFLAVAQPRYRGYLEHVKAETVQDLALLALAYRTIGNEVRYLETLQKAKAQRRTMRDHQWYQLALRGINIFMSPPSEERNETKDIPRYDNRNAVVRPGASWAPEGSPFETEVVAINLERRPDRMGNLIHQFRGRPFNLLTATDWTKGDIPGDFKLVTGFDFKAKDPHISIEKGGLACYWSHCRALKYLTSGETERIRRYDGSAFGLPRPPAKDFILVVEDDISILRSYAYLEDRLRKVPDDWDMITVGSLPFPIYDNDQSVVPIADGVCRWKGLFVNAHFYFIRKEMAAYFLKYLAYPTHEYLDVVYAAMIFHGFNIYNIDDYCIQNNFITDIQNLMEVEYQSKSYNATRGFLYEFVYCTTGGKIEGEKAKALVEETMTRMMGVIEAGADVKIEESEFELPKSPVLQTCFDSIVRSLYEGRRGNKSQNEVLARAILQPLIQAL